jgi:serine/threonine protein kinase
LVEVVKCGVLINPTSLVGDSSHTENSRASYEMLRFDRSKILGKGGFATVFEGVWNGRAVAVKRVLLKNTKFHGEDALVRLDHPNVIKMLHEERDEDFR